MEIITKSATQTYQLGQKIGFDLKGGEVLALVGDLGSGKTTFIQGLADSIGIKSRIISPTFILMRKYESKKADFYHLDLYRLEGSVEDEMRNLGLLDLWGKKENIVVIEWAQKANNIYPKDTIWFEFSYISDTERKIVIKK